MSNDERLKRAYDMGVDYARNGANTTNCHFSLFATPLMTKQWERGRDDEQSKRTPASPEETR